MRILKKITGIQKCDEITITTRTYDFRNNNKNIETHNGLFDLKYALLYYYLW